MKNDVSRGIGRRQLLKALTAAIKNPARGGAWCRSLLVFESEGAAVTAAKRTDHLTICTADSILRMNNALASTEDVLDVFPDEAISACAAIRSLHYAARNGCELIKSEFGVGHWIEVVVEGHPLSMNTPSPESMAEVMT